MKKRISNFLIFILLGILLSAFKGYAQDEEFEYTFELSTLKNADNTRTLEIAFYGEMDRDVFPVYGASIDFYNVLDEEKVLLGTVTTSDEGIAKLVLDEGVSYLKDEDGYITLTAEFTGSDQIDSFEEELSVIDLSLRLEMEESEDGNSLIVYADAIMNDGELVPVEESDIYFYVQSMINKLPIGDDWLEEGEYTFDFPQDIPGDKEGNLLVHVRIEDNDDYGNVIQSITVPWGVGSLVQPVQSRSLWSDMAPQWMMVVLTILLILVWANILHAVYSLFRIKKVG